MCKLSAHSSSQTGSRRLQDIIAERRFKTAGAGHTLHLPEDRPAETAVTWVTTEGRTGRLRQTWRTFSNNLAQVDMSHGMNVQLSLPNGRAGDNSLLPSVPSHMGPVQSHHYYQQQINNALHARWQSCHATTHNDKAPSAVSEHPGTSLFTLLCWSQPTMQWQKYTYKM